MLGKSVRNILSEIIQCIVSNIFSPFIQKNPLTVFINGHFVYLENICSIYNQNKKILLNKSDVFFEFLERYISNMEFDLSFLEKMESEKTLNIFSFLRQYCILIKHNFDSTQLKYFK